MKQLAFCLFSFFAFPFFPSAQTVKDLIDQVSQEGIVQMVRNLSGEDSIQTVDGRTVLIRHRVSAEGNDLAAGYLSEVFSSYGLDVSDIRYSNTGRNIVAVQKGKTNPNNIYLICAHYDAVGDHGADDNASGTTAVLESARILSKNNFENTIVYALWDEEEIGLVGAKNYARAAAENKDNILAVMNMDMMAYDSNDDRLFDIDVRNIADSYTIRDDLIKVVKDYDLNLVPKVVDPGTPNSDHGAFWDEGFSAALLGEAWSDDDITPGYHTAKNDRINFFNIDYFFHMVQLCVGYIATKGTLLNPNLTNK